MKHEGVVSPRIGFQGSTALIVALSAFIVGVGFLTSLTFITSTIPLGFLILALVAGVASFFNPCCLPLFPALLTHIYSTGGIESRRDFGNTLQFGLAGASGVLTLLLIFGIIIAAVGDFGFKAVMPSIGFRTARGVAGIVMILFGAMTLGGRGLSLNLGRKWMGLDAAKPTRAMYIYGFAYTLLGLGCTAPILGGLTIAALFAGGFTQAFGVFMFGSLVMAVLMVIMTFVVRGQRRIPGIWLGKIKNAGGLIFIGVGSFILLEVLLPEIFVPITHPWLR